MPSAIYKQFDIIIVPFPFSESKASKRRPALLLSTEQFLDVTGHGILAMITSTRQAWKYDVLIQDVKAAGLDTPCAVRMKLFTLDARLFLRRAGSLGAKDRPDVIHHLKKIMLL